MRIYVIYSRYMKGYYCPKKGWVKNIEDAFRTKYKNIKKVDLPQTPNNDAKWQLYSQSGIKLFNIITKKDLRTWLNILEQKKFAPAHDRTIEMLKFLLKKKRKKFFLF